MVRTGFLFALALMGSGCATTAEQKTLLTWNGGEKEGEEKEDEEEDEEEFPPFATDRPDFTEASSTVGKGRIQLESGYTFSRDGDSSTQSHSYPEALLRIGMFADWFELRLGQNFSSSRDATPDVARTFTGGEDLYIGSKLWLTEQRGVFPELAMIVQATVPTGHGDLTARKTLPGLSYLYGWDVIPDRITFAGSTQGNSAVDDDDRTYFELAQSLTVGYSLAERLGAYTEWFAFFPSGATAGVGPEYYFNGGLTYRVLPNVQVDVRAGVGLNRQSDDYFVGSGFAFRY